jgi:hypothetical protein
MYTTCWPPREAVCCWLLLLWLLGLIIGLVHGIGCCRLSLASICIGVASSWHHLTYVTAPHEDIAERQGGQSAADIQLGVLDSSCPSGS